jgi:hypothetical protein
MLARLVSTPDAMQADTLVEVNSVQLFPLKRRPDARTHRKLQNEMGPVSNGPYEKPTFQQENLIPFFFSHT